MTSGTVTRRTFVLGLSSLPALAGCVGSGRLCRSGEHSIGGITKRESIGAAVRVGGQVRGTYEASATGTTWFTLDDGSGIALVTPAERWGEKVHALGEGRCVTVAGQLEAVYEGEYTSCVDPADGTCSFLTEDVKIGDARWTETDDLASGSTPGG